MGVLAREGSITKGVASSVRASLRACGFAAHAAPGVAEVKATIGALLGDLNAPARRQACTGAPEGPVLYDLSAGGGHRSATHDVESMAAFQDAMQCAFEVAFQKCGTDMGVLSERFANLECAVVARLDLFEL